MNAYNDLRHGAPARLALYRRKLAASLATAEKAHGRDSAFFAGLSEPGAWRRERWITPHGLGFNAPRGGVTHGRMHGVDVIHVDSGYFDHLRPCDTKCEEWYTDAYHSETVGGRVARLPHNRYLAYLKWSGADGLTALCEVFDSARDAAAAADRLARRVAEDEREYSEKWHEARELQEENEEAHERMRGIRDKVSRRLAVIRALPESAASEREHMAGQVQDLREDFAAILADLIERNNRIAQLRAEGIDA